MNDFLIMLNQSFEFKKILTTFTDSEPAFERRVVTIRKDKWVTDEFDLLEFLGRLEKNNNKKIK